MAFKWSKGILKRRAVENIHPLVRTHPVTGEKALYGFTRYIVGIKIGRVDHSFELSV